MTAAAPKLREAMGALRDTRRLTYSPSIAFAQLASAVEAVLAAYDARAARKAKRQARGERPAVDGTRTPAEWDAMTIGGIRILDPDGWRGPTDPPWDQPITRAEFLWRRDRCTVNGVAPPARPGIDPAAFDAAVGELVFRANQWGRAAERRFTNGPPTLGQAMDAALLEENAARAALRALVLGDGEVAP